jgi:hypothetical protein
VPSIFISGKSDWRRGGQIIVDRLPARTGRWLGPNLPVRRHQTCAQVADASFRPSNGRIARVAFWHIADLLQLRSLVRPDA